MKTFVIGDVHGRLEQLNQLLMATGRDASKDTLVLLGDLIDRGDDAAGVVAGVMELQRSAGTNRVIALRGNHEQMLLDFLDGKNTLWLHAAARSDATMRSYGVAHEAGEYDEVSLTDEELDDLRAECARLIPTEHVEFFRSMPLYYEDDCALYVHAGLHNGKHPRDTAPTHLLWSRDVNFFRHYQGKPCVFGHTPTQFLPLRGRLGRHGIYVFHSAIGIDTGYAQHAPLSCLELPSFVLRQSFADGRLTTRRITALIPPTLRLLHEENCRREQAAMEHEDAQEFDWL